MALSASRLLALLGTLVVGTSVVAAIAINPPWDIRVRKLDQKRVEALESIARSLTKARIGEGSLPETLPDSWALPMRDPETAEIYAYERTGDATFRFCAVFGHATDDRDREFSLHNAEYRQNWSHKQGRSCFSGKVDLNDKYADAYIRPE